MSLSDVMNQENASSGDKAIEDSTDFDKAIFSVRNLLFSYDSQKKQLDGLSLALFSGESIGLCGANGAGKTTLFRCISGLSIPQAGEIRLGAKIMRSEKDFYELRRHVGYVLQNSDDQLFFPTVLEDLAFGPLNLGLSAEEARTRAQESLDLVGLSSYGERLSHHLSGGEKKLVALASILAMQPKALLLDEPLTGLDEEAQIRISDIVSRLDCAKLIISHDQNFLNRVCDRKLLLKKGKLESLPAL